MSDKDKIGVKVQSLKRTRRVQLLLDYAVRGLFWGALAAAVVIFAARLWILPVSEYLAGGALAGALLIGFAVRALFVRLTPLKVANDIDLALGLRERVSSAVAFSAAGETIGPFEKTVVKDAARTVEHLPLKRVYPWRIPPAWKLALPALVIAALLSFVPQLNWFVSDSERAEAQLIKSEGSKLIDVAKQLEEEAEKLKDPVLKEQAKELQRVGEKLESGQIGKKEALKELQRLKDKLETQAQQQLPPGERKLTGELAAELKKNPSTRELGELLEENGAQEMLNQMQQLMEDLKQGNLSSADQQMMQDFLKAMEEALKSESASDQTAQSLKQAMEDLKGAMAQEQQLRDQLQQAMESFEQDVNKLTSELSNQGMNQDAQQLQSLMQQMNQQMQQQGSVNPQTLEQMKQQLEATEQAVQNNQSLSPQEQQNLQKMVDEAQQNLESETGEQGQLSQSNQQLQQNRQEMAQQMQKQSDCMGGGWQGGKAGQLAEMIAQMKAQMGYGKMLAQGQGGQSQAQSGWGLGVSPQAVSPAPADSEHQVEDRQGDDSLGDTEPTTYEQLYTAEEYAHSFSSEEQLKGQFDPRQSPQRVEEVNSIPETQEALAKYIEIIGAYAEGEEQAVALEQIPLEYQELVKLYFSQIKKDAGGKEKSDSEDSADEESAE